MAVTRKRLLWTQLQIDFCCIHPKIYCFSFSRWEAELDALSLCPGRLSTHIVTTESAESGKRKADCMEIPLGVRTLLWKTKGNIDARML